MKTFLTICTCAMVTAGIYGFTDMAVDVKNGTMIRYDHDGEEAEDISVAAVNTKMLKDKKVAAQKKTIETKAIKKESTATTKVKTNTSTSPRLKIKKEVPVVDENPIQETVIVEEARTDVKVDSAPQEIILEREYDYSDFSRGAPRKHKKVKKSKKD